MRVWLFLFIFFFSHAGDRVVLLNATHSVFEFEEYQDRVLEQPRQVLLDNSYLYIADAGSKLWRINTNSFQIEVIADKGEGPGELIPSIFNLYSWNKDIVVIDKSGFRMNYFNHSGLFQNFARTLFPLHFDNRNSWSLSIRYESRHKATDMKDDMYKNVIFSYITDRSQDDMLLADPESDYVPFFKCRLNIYHKWGLFFSEMGRKQVIYYSLWDLEKHSIVDKGQKTISDLSIVVGNNVAGGYNYTFGCTNHEALGYVITEARRKLNRTDCYIKLYDPETLKWHQLLLNFKAIGSWFEPSFFCFLKENRWAVIDQGKLFIFEVDKSQNALLAEINKK